MTTPIIIPIEVPGAATGKQQVDALGQSLQNLDDKAKRGVQTSGQATDAHNKNAQAIRARIEATKAAEAATIRGVVADTRAATAAKETTTALQQSTRAAKEKEAAFNKMGENIAKLSPIAGQAVKAMGTTFGAVGLAASAVGKLITATWTTMVNHIVEESERGGKGIRALVQAQQIIGDAKTARGREASTTMEQQKDAFNTLAATGGDKAILQAQQFAKRNDQDVGTVMETMAKMRNAGMTQDEAMHALEAAHESSVLGYGSFSAQANKAAAMPPKTFTGNTDKDLEMVSRPDDKTDPKAALEASNTRKALNRARSNALNEGAMERYIKEDENWQRLNNGGADDPRDDPQTAARKRRNRPVRPDGKALWYDDGSSAGGPGVGSQEDIRERRRMRGRSEIAGQVDAYEGATADIALTKTQTAIEYGSQGAAQAASDAAAESRSPGVTMLNKERTRLSIERDVAGSKMEAMEATTGISATASAEYMEARAEFRRANEAMDRLAEAIDKLTGGGGANGGGGPMKVEIVGGLPSSANGDN